MELKDLKIFVRVVEEGDFSTAARSLDVTPSSVSKAIGRLEDHLGRRLLQRSSRTMRLTNEGEEFLEAARRVLVAAEEAEAVGAVAVVGTLHVRCVPAFARHQLALAIPEFCRQHPALRIEFFLTTERSAHLDEGADVALTSGLPPESSLIARRFSGSRWVICASSEYLGKHGNPAHPRDLVAHDCLNFPPHSPWDKWPKISDDDERAGPVGRIVANQAEMLLALAQAGAGVARLPEFQIAKDLRSGALVRLFPEHQDQEEEPLYLLYHARRNLSPRIRAFLTFAERSFAHRPWRLDG